MKTTDIFARIAMAIALASIAFTSAALADGPEYAVTVLGDLHYDAQDLELFHGTNKAYYAGVTPGYYGRDATEPTKVFTLR